MSNQVEPQKQKFHFEVQLTPVLFIGVMVLATDLNAAGLILQNEFFKQHDFSGIELTTIQPQVLKVTRTPLIHTPNTNGKKIIVN